MADSVEIIKSAKHNDITVMEIINNQLSKVNNIKLVKHVDVVYEQRIYQGVTTLMANFVIIILEIMKENSVGNLVDFELEDNLAQPERMHI